MAGDDEPLSYGAYLRVPELISLQSPLGSPEVHDELLFIILQQAQELWFKQILHELGAVVAAMGSGHLAGATRLLARVNRILRVLGEELEVMEHYTLAEALSEYEIQFVRWRFRHAQLVERVIGHGSAGTGGSSGTDYLMGTVRYRFFPELWEARRRLSDGINVRRSN
ncbi:MAG: tryptophan 2,3-dioxygenase family protein [Chloroflexota bacterium]